MFKLIIVFSFGIVNSHENNMEIEFEHLFRTQTGCYLAGRIELEHARQQHYFDNAPDQMTIDIQCKMM